MELSFASDLLSGQWVYHKDLINTHPDLYSLVKARFDRMNEENELASAAANCRALAAEERAKELALIEQFLSVQSRVLKPVKVRLDSAPSSQATLLLR
jgi:hypothetical protein